MMNKILFRVFSFGLSIFICTFSATSWADVKENTFTGDVCSTGAAAIEDQTWQKTHIVDVCYSFANQDSIDISKLNDVLNCMKQHSASAFTLANFQDCLTDHLRQGECIKSFPFNSPI